jgi:hypothetical protein
MSYNAPVPENHRKLRSYLELKIQQGLHVRKPWDKARERIGNQFVGDFTSQFREAGGEPYAEAGTPQDTATISLVYSTASTVMPYLYYKNPKIAARPHRGMPDSGRGKLLSNFSEYLHYEQDYKSVTKQAIMYTLLFGMGCMVTEWDDVRGLPMRRHVPMERIVVNPEATDDNRTVRFVAERIVMPLRVARADKSLKHRGAIEPTMAMEPHDKKTRELQKKVGINDEMVSGWKIWIRDDLPGMVYTSDPDKAKPLVESEITETKNRVIVIFDGSPYIHRDEAWPYVFDVEEFPYTFLRFNTEPGHFHGFSDFAVTKGVQEFINWQFSFMLRRARKACTDKILHSDLLEDDAVEKLVDGIDMQTVEVNHEHFQEIQRLVHVLKFEGLDPEHLALLERAKGYYDEVVGVTSYMRGGQPASGSRSATQASVEDERAQNRINEKLDHVESWLSKLARKDVQMAAQLITVQDQYEVVTELSLAMNPEGRLMPVEPEFAEGMETIDLVEGQLIDGSFPALQDLVMLGAVIIKQRGMAFYVGPELSQAWRDDIKVEELRREIDVFVEHGTTRKVNKQQEIQDRSQLMNTLVPVYMQFGMIHKVADAVNKFITSFDVDDVDSLKITQEDLQQLMGQGQGGAFGQAVEESVNRNQDGAGNNDPGQILAAIQAKAAAAQNGKRA